MGVSNVSVVMGFVLLFDFLDDDLVAGSTGCSTICRGIGAVMDFGMYCGAFGGDFSESEGRWKSHHRSLCISLPYVEEPLNSKVIKGFVPKLRSVFHVSRFLCSMYICYEHYMYVSHIRIMGMVHMGQGTNYQIGT